MDFEDFIKIWMEIRGRVGPDNDKIVEELKKAVDFKNLTPPDKIMGNPMIKQSPKRASK